MLLHGDGLTVAHVTLHMALRDVFAYLTIDAVRERIDLLDELLPALHGRRPRLAVAALNPHASDGGLFGDEEEKIIRPAVEEAKARGVIVTGPLPAVMPFMKSFGSSNARTHGWPVAMAALIASMPCGVRGSAKA